jgi:hypothetical protein
MNETIEFRIRTAATATWWTVLIGLGVLLIQWLLYLVFTALQPGWLLSLWGPNASWNMVQQIWFWGLAIIKACLFLVAFIALWLTLWARQLRKQHRT